MVPQGNVLSRARREGRLALMETTIRHEDESMEVVLEGRLTTEAAPELEKQLREELDDATELVFDLTDLTYIASSGLRVLLSMQKIMKHQGSMIVRGANSEIMDIFEMTGFVNLLTIE